MLYDAKTDSPSLLPRLQYRLQVQVTLPNSSNRISFYTPTITLDTEAHEHCPPPPSYTSIVALT
jgi:hypothetical protein